MGLETLEPRLLLSGQSGPDAFRVSDLRLTGATVAAERVEVEFSEAVAAGTFDLSDIALTVGGAPATITNPVVALSDTVFEINLAGIAGLDLYTLEIGPDIENLSGGLLDQDGDGTAGEVGEDVYQAAVASTDIAIADGGAQYDGADLIIHGAVATIDGHHAFTGLRVESGGLLTHSVSTEADVYSLSLAISGTLEIDATSSIDVTGRGYVDNHTLGNVDLGVDGQAGGSYGGLGNVYSDWPVGDVYGDFANPSELGSGGRGENDSAGHGGGLVRITAGAATVDGAIIADGGAGRYYDYRAGGGGSGGGVYLDVGTLSGAGTISADGGIGYTTQTGAGGGGRVAVYYSDGMTLDPASLTAAGGATGSATGRRPRRCGWMRSGCARGHNLTRTWTRCWAGWTTRRRSMKGSRTPAT